MVIVQSSNAAIAARRVRRLPNQAAEINNSRASIIHPMGGLLRINTDRNPNVKNAVPTQKQTAAIRVKLRTEY